MLFEQNVASNVTRNQELKHVKLVQLLTPACTWAQLEIRIYADKTRLKNVF